jgi:hypothetical protein
MANDVRVTLGMDTKQADDALKKYQMNVKKAGLALSAVGAAGSLAVKKFTSAALEQEKALAGVLNSARNTGESMAGFEQKVLSATAALQNKTNFGDEEQLRVLTKMIPVLGSTENALAALPAIMDAAATTGRDLGAQAETLTKALAGQVHTAESLGIKFDQNADFQERLAVVMGLVSGAAEAQADPFTQLNNAFGDMQEQIGAALLPILKSLAEMLSGLVERMNSLHPDMVKIVAITLAAATAFGVIGGPILLLIGFLPAIAAGFAMVTAAAAPISLTIIGIAAAITAGIAIWKNWDKIMEFFQTRINKVADLLERLKNKVMSVANAIKNSGIGRAIGSVTSAVGSVGGMLGFANGGVVPPPIGAPRLAIVHGGERILTPHQAQSGNTSSLNNTINVTVNASTNANPEQIAHEVASTLGRMGIGSEQTRSS